MFLANVIPGAGRPCLANVLNCEYHVDKIVFANAQRKNAQNIIKKVFPMNKNRLLKTSLDNAVSNLSATFNSRTQRKIKDDKSEKLEISSVIS